MEVQEVGFLLAMHGIPHSSPRATLCSWVGAEHGVVWQMFPTGSLEFEYVFPHQSCEAKSQLITSTAAVKLWEVYSP